MNLLPIYVHNGEVLYNKEGFPEKPSIEDYPHEPIKFAELCMKWDDDLKTSIDKALRFEESDKLKKLLSPYHIYKSCCRSIDECYCVKDGAYKLPDGWRVVEQWQYQALSDTWNDFQSDVFDIENMNKQGFATRLIARLVPVKKQEKVDGFDYKQWNQETESYNEESLPLASSIVPPFDPIVNTTASDKTPSPVKTAEEILSTVNNAEWTGEGEPLFSYDQVIGVMNVYAYQFRGEMTTK